MMCVNFVASLFIHIGLSLNYGSSHLLIGPWDCNYFDQIAAGKSFSSEDYLAETPSWAVYGALEGGFDPNEVRVKKERRHGPSADSGGCT